jgi:hypothetical protein
MRGYAWLTEIVQVLSMFRVRAGWGRLRSHIWWSLQGPGASIFVFLFVISQRVKGNVHPPLAHYTLYEQFRVMSSILLTILVVDAFPRRSTSRLGLGGSGGQLELGTQTSSGAEQLLHTT